MTANTPLPHDLDAEAAVLAAAILHPPALYQVQAVIRSERDFYSDANRWIWRATEELERTGSKVDTVTIAQWLRTQERLEACGGTRYLMQLTDSTPAVAHVGEHARIVAGLAHRRRLIDTLKASAAEGYGDVGDPFEWAQRVEHRVYEASRNDIVDEGDGSLAVVAPAVYDEVVAIKEGKSEPPGLSTGFPMLDRRINGLKNGKVYVVAGRPGMGKTAIMGQIGTNVASGRRLVVEICTEQNRTELTRRKIAQDAVVSYSKLERGRIDDADWSRVIASVERLRKIPLGIEPMNRPTIAEIRSAIRRSLARLRKHHGDLPIGLISIDQLQHLDGQGQRGESREVEVARLSREIAWMAGEFDCPILLAAQLNRGVESRPDKRPKMSDLRESGAVEQDAYGVLFPFRPQYYEQQERGGSNGGDKSEPCEVIVGKHKNGPAGSVALTFHGPSMSFATCDDHDDDGRYGA
jgi:replicative DNA helicase